MNHTFQLVIELMLIASPCYFSLTCVYIWLSLSPPHMITLPANSLSGLDVHQLFFVNKKAGAKLAASSTLLRWPLDSSLWTGRTSIIWKHRKVITFTRIEKQLRNIFVIFLLYIIRHLLNNSCYFEKILLIISSLQAVTSDKKESQSLSRLWLSFLLAGETGIEPATNGFGVRYSTN